MKKFGLVLLTFILVILGAIQVFAAESVVAVDTASVVAADKIVVTVSLKDGGNIKSMGITPIYDKGVFELVAAKWLVSGTIIDDFDQKNGNGVMLMASAKECNGEIFVFELKVKDSAAAGKYGVSANLIIKDGNNKDVECSIVETKITIEAADSAETSVQTDIIEQQPEAEDTQTTDVGLVTEVPSSDVVTDEDVKSESVAEDESDDFVYTDGFLVDDVEETKEEDLLNKNTALWIGIAVVVCILAGFGLASIKKQK